MKQSELIRLLLDNGFSLMRQSAHMIYGKETIRVAVPRHRMLNGKTVHFILRNAGLK